jgi:hypothetical protein
MRWIKAAVLGLLFVGPAQADTSNPAMLAFTACRRAIFDAAQPNGAVVFEIVMTGPTRRLWTGETVVTLFVRIDYQRRGGREVRRAHVECTFGSTGAVTITSLGVVG